MLGDSSPSAAEFSAPSLFAQRILIVVISSEMNSTMSRTLLSLELPSEGLGFLCTYFENLLFCSHWKWPFAAPVQRFFLLLSSGAHIGSCSNHVSCKRLFFFGMRKKERIFFLEEIMNQYIFIIHHSVLFHDVVVFEYVVTEYCDMPTAS